MRADTLSFSASSKLKSTEAFSDEAWSDLSSAMSESVRKKTTHSKMQRSASRSGGISGYPSTLSPEKAADVGMQGMLTQMPSMPMMTQVAMVPMQQSQMECDTDEVVVEETYKLVMESIKPVWESKLAERECHWQSVLQQMQARMSVLSMHMNANDPALQSQIARLQQQIAALEDRIRCLMQQGGEQKQRALELTALLAGRDQIAQQLELVVGELQTDLIRTKKELEEAKEQLALERKQKEDFFAAVVEKREQGIIDQSCHEHSKALCQEIADLSAHNACLADEAEGAKVQIERLQGIVSLLQVKVAERDDIRVQSCFNLEERFNNVHDDEFRALRESWTAQVSEKYEAEISQAQRQVAERDQELESLRLALETSRRNEQIAEQRVQHEKEECGATVRKIKESYSYLDKCIMMDPSTFCNKPALQNAHTPAFPSHQPWPKDNSSEAARTPKATLSPRMEFLLQTSSSYKAAATESVAQISSSTGTSKITTSSPPHVPHIMQPTETRPDATESLLQVLASSKATKEIPDSSTESLLEVDANCKATSRIVDDALSILQSASQPGVLRAMATDMDVKDMKVETLSEDLEARIRSTEEQLVKG